MRPRKWPQERGPVNQVHYKPLLDIVTKLETNVITFPYASGLFASIGLNLQAVIGYCEGKIVYFDNFECLQTRVLRVEEGRRLGLAFLLLHPALSDDNNKGIVIAPYDGVTDPSLSPDDPQIRDFSNCGVANGMLIGQTILALRGLSQRDGFQNPPLPPEFTLYLPPIANEPPT